MSIKNLGIGGMTMDLTSQRCEKFSTKSGYNVRINAEMMTSRLESTSPRVK